MEGLSRAGSFLTKVAGNAVVLRHLRGQRSIPYAPRRRIEALRDARVQAVVRYAAETVPYYRETFRRLGLDPRDLATAHDLERLPIIDKDDLRRDPERFVAASALGRDSVVFVSSGSSGKSAPFRHDRRSLLANIAYGERERQAIVSLVGRAVAYREVSIGYPEGTIRRVRAFYREATWLKRPVRAELSVMDPFATIAERLNAFRPDVIAGFGNYLAALARAVARGDVSLHPPKVFIYSAEGLSRDTRLEIERSLGAPLLSFYSAVESFKIGFLCEAREGFHVHEDLCDVRIVDGAGRNVTDGATGDVVISNLVNRGTVLLGYRIGDRASFAEGRTCACGRTFRSLAEIEGRFEDVIELGPGRILHPRAIWGVIKPLSEVLQYQLAEERPEEFELRLVTKDEADFGAVAQKLERDVGALLGARGRVTAVRRQRLVAESSGKLRIVVTLPRSRDR